MIALVLLLRYSLLLLGFGRSPFCKREMRERERAKEGRVFFLGAIMTTLCSFFLFLFVVLVLFLVFVLSRAKGQKSDSRWRR